MLVASQPPSSALPRAPLSDSLARHLASQRAQQEEVPIIGMGSLDPQDARAVKEGDMIAEEKGAKLEMFEDEY